MPELPEVEVARLNLSRWLGGRRITAVQAPKTRVLRPHSPAALIRIASGERVREVERKGKWLRIHFASGAALYSHLGMSGRWVKRKKKDETELHERFRIDVAGASIRYIDPRLFGRLVARGPDQPFAAWDQLGPDPLRDGLDAGVIENALLRVRRSIKETLLDQRLFAGIGNIQATEALWLAKIDPRRPAKDLTTTEIRALLRGIDRSIAETLSREKGPEITYVEDPGAPNPFRVYGRSGHPCPRCRTVLVRIVQGARSTVFCPRCQGTKAQSAARRRSAT